MPTQRVNDPNQPGHGVLMMNLSSQPIRLALAMLAVTMIATGCARIRDHKGFVGEAVLVTGIQAGIDNRESVEQTLGRPTFVSQFDKNVWYYVSRDTRQIAFRNPKPVDQYVLTVQFDQRGSVTAVNKTGKDRIVSLTPDDDRTPTLGRDRGFFRELFGNIGTVGAVGQGGGTADNPN